MGVFSPGERDVIVKYYAAHKHAAKPLPPGIARNLARGKPLPPGIAKQVVSAELLGQLPGRATGVEIVIVGDRVVLLNARGLVVDIVVGVFH